MFSHVVVGTNDLEKATRFYNAVLGTLGAAPGTDIGGRFTWTHNGNTLMVTPPVNGDPATYANGGTIGFTADSFEQVKAWYEAGMANGATPCVTPPVRNETDQRTYCVAYMRDPDGNKLCALHTISG